MRGDFSRVTFRPENHFSGVLLQQGRVQLDAEFNEHVDDRGPPRSRDDARRDRPRGRAASTAAASRSPSPRCCAASPPATTRGRWARTGRVLRSVGGTAPVDASSRVPAGDRPAERGRRRARRVGLGGRRRGGDPAAGAGPAGRPSHRRRRSRPTCTACTATPTARGRSAPAGPCCAWDGTGVGAPGAGRRRHGDAARRPLRRRHRRRRRRRRHDPRDREPRDGLDACRPRRRAPATCTASSSPTRSTAGRSASQGTVLFFDGTAWARQAVSPGSPPPCARSCSPSASEGTAVGDGGIALAFDGGAWQHESTGRRRRPARARGAARRGDAGRRRRRHAHPLGTGRAWTTGPGDAGGRRPARAGGRWRSRPATSTSRASAARTSAPSRSTASPSHRSTRPRSRRPSAGTYGVFLHVQEQHLTATEREELREVALGGPDTATRTRTVWQAGLVELDDAATATCADVAAAGPHDPPRGRLRARAVPAAVEHERVHRAAQRRLPAAREPALPGRDPRGTAPAARPTSGRATTGA